jgi:hypothetical protein
MGPVMFPSLTFPSNRRKLGGLCNDADQYAITLKVLGVLFPHEREVPLIGDELPSKGATGIMRPVDAATCLKPICRY